jgi:hypothetical protein
MKGFIFFILLSASCFGEFLETDSILGNSHKIQANDTFLLKIKPITTHPKTIACFDSASGIVKQCSTSMVGAAPYDSAGKAHYADSSGLCHLADTTKHFGSITGHGRADSTYYAWRLRHYVTPWKFEYSSPGYSNGDSLAVDIAQNDGYNYLAWSTQPENANNHALQLRGYSTGTASGYNNGAYLQLFGDQTGSGVKAKLCFIDYASAEYNYGINTYNGYDYFDFIRRGNYNRFSFCSMIRTSPLRIKWHWTVDDTTGQFFLNDSSTLADSIRPWLPVDIRHGGLQIDTLSEMTNTDSIACFDASHLVRRITKVNLKTGLGFTCDSLRMYDGTNDTLNVYSGGKIWKFLPIADQ